LGVNVEKSALLAVNNKSRQASTAAMSFKSTQLPGQEAEIFFEDIQRVKDEYKIIEDKFASHLTNDHKISFLDIEAVLHSYGVHSPQKRMIEQMIWEVDELADGCVCWDELQLAYRRNVDDATGNEPSSFFRLVEFLTFDQGRKRFITEDDCMEILFVRYGSSKLETELKFIFGDALRSNGGDGSITFEGYLRSCLARTGRRAPLM